MARKILDGLYLGAGMAAAFFLFAIFALMMIMSLGREAGINVPAGDDFAAWSMAAMSFLGLAHTFKRGEMIRVGLLTEHLHGRARQIADIVALSIVLAFIGFFAFHAAIMVRDSWRFNDMAQGSVAMPLWFPQLFVFVGLAILVIAVVDELLHVLAGNRPRYELPPPATPEELVARVAEGGGV